jgi:hypothetical protein
MVSGSRSIQRFGQSDLTRHVFATGRMLELYMLNRRPFMSASDLQMGSYATQYVGNSLAETPHWEIIEMYWYTAMVQNKISSTVFEARTNELWKMVC